MYWVYILICLKNGKFTNFYVGQTVDYEKRMKEHMSHARKGYTKSYCGRFDSLRPVWKKKVPTRAEALRLERKLKGFSRQKKWNLVKKQSGVQDS